MIGLPRISVRASRFVRAGLGRASAPSRLSCLLVLVLSACAPSAPRSPDEAVSQWYTMLDALGTHTVPEPQALDALRPFMSDTLHHLMQRAHAVRDSVRALVPREKPPFVDGELFASLFEGYTAWNPMDTRAVGNTALVIMAFVNDTQKPEVRWTDTVIVVRERNRYVVTDVRYGAGWDFAAKGTLQHALEQALQIEPPQEP